MTDGKKNDLFTLFFKMIIVGALALISQGCASVGENAALMNARAAYEKAKADPVVTANAQVPLYEAGQALNKAEKAENEPEMTHLAYLAEKRTAIAVATAQEKVSLDERENLAAEKDRLLLEQKKRQLTTARGEAEAASTQVKELEQELAELKAKRTDRGYVVTLGDILFATNKANLMPGAQRTIDQVATFLNKHPEMRAIVEGHTDSTGSAEYNLTLSKARAESVRSAIMMRGINPQQISAEGRGELIPVASNANVAGRQQNRRVEILFVSDKQLPVR